MSFLSGLIPDNSECDNAFENNIIVVGPLLCDCFTQLVKLCLGTMAAQVDIPQISLDCLNIKGVQGGRHSTEVAFALLTQQPRV